MTPLHPTLVVELTRLAVAERVANAARQHSSSRRSAGHLLDSPSSPRWRRSAPGALLRGLTWPRAGRRRHAPGACMAVGSQPAC